MEQKMNYILFYGQKYKEYPDPFLPNFKVKDKNGFSQNIIMKSLKTQDNKLITVAKNFKRLISYIKIAENKENRCRSQIISPPNCNIQKKH